MSRITALTGLHAHGAVGCAMMALALVVSVVQVVRRRPHDPTPVSPAPTVLCMVGFVLAMADILS